MKLGFTSNLGAAGSRGSARTSLFFSQKWAWIPARIPGLISRPESGAPNIFPLSRTRSGLYFTPGFWAGNTAQFSAHGCQIWALCAAIFRTRAGSFSGSRVFVSGTAVPPVGDPFCRRVCFLVAPTSPLSRSRLASDCFASTWTKQPRTKPIHTDEIKQGEQIKHYLHLNPNLAGRGGRSEKRPVLRA